jgi:hypothetical protein
MRAGGISASINSGSCSLEAWLAQGNLLRLKYSLCLVSGGGGEWRPPLLFIAASKILTVTLIAHALVLTLTEFWFALNATWYCCTINVKINIPIIATCLYIGVKSPELSISECNSPSEPFERGGICWQTCQERPTTTQVVSFLQLNRAYWNHVKKYEEKKALTAIYI